MNRKTTCRAAIVGVLLAGASAGANAAVMSWDFRAFGGFEGPNNDAGFPAASEHYLDVINTDGDYGHFGWGTPQGADHSHLTINELDPTTPSGDLTKYYRNNGLPNEVQPGVADLHGNILNQITTSDPDGEVIGWAVHHNNPIDEIFGSADNPAIIRTNYHLQLIDPANPGVVVWDSGEMDFTVGVWETSNAAPCPPDGNATGPNGTVCDDRFNFGLGWDGVTRPTGSVFDEMIGAFSYLGDNYVVSMTGFWDEINGVEQLAGAFWSGEGDFRHMEVRAEVHIPEPATLALMGLGLAGLGFSAKRRQRRIEQQA